MTPKTMLCVVRESETLDDARRAVDLASASGVHLSFAVVGIALPPPAAVAYAAPLDVWVEERDQIQAAISAKAEELEAMLKQADISGDVSQHYVVSGGASSLVGLRARYADLALIFPETEANRTLRDAALRGLIFEGGIPFIVTPAERTPSLRPESVVVAWNGTLEAARAVHAAMDIMSAAKAVSVAMVDPQETEWQSGEEPGFDIAAFLARHGIAVEVDRLASGGKDVSDVMLRHAEVRDADLLVMGAYGHSRLREYVFGGTTRETLERTTVPVLMMR